MPRPPKEYKYGRCTAKAKSTGVRCLNDSEPGFKVCGSHGGKTPRGEDSPHFKHGRSRRHKVLPPRMVEAYESSLTDSELLSLRQELSLVDARLTDILKRVDTGESGQLWRSLQAAYDGLREARSTNDGTKMASYLNDIGALIQRGMGDYAAWDEISRLMEQRRRLVESESRRLKDMQAMISAEEAMAVIGELYVILQTHIEDSVILDRIGRDITARLAARPHVIEAG